MVSAPLASSVKSATKPDFWYNQRTGIFYERDTRFDRQRWTTVAVGYSGRAEGKNNPRWEKIAGKGPIPKGYWEIQAGYASRRLGPLAIPLRPHVTTVTYGRSAFLIHGDSKLHPGQASSGCIILPWAARSRIARHVGGVLCVSDEPPDLI